MATYMDMCPFPACLSPFVFCVFCDWTLYVPCLAILSAQSPCLVLQIAP